MRRTRFTSTNLHRPRQLSVHIHLFYGTAANTAEEGEHGGGYMAPSVSKGWPHPFKRSILARASLQAKPTTSKEDAPPEAPASIKSNVNATAPTSTSTGVPPHATAVDAPRLSRPQTLCRRRRRAPLPLLIVLGAREAHRVTHPHHLRGRGGPPRRAELVGAQRALRARSARLPRVTKRTRLRTLACKCEEDEIRVRRGVRLLHEATEEMEEKETRAELAGAVGSGKSWAMKGGRPEEMQGMIPRAVAQVFGATGQRQYLHDGGPAAHRDDAHERVHWVSTLRIRGPHARGAGALNRADLAQCAPARGVGRVKAKQRSASSTRSPWRGARGALASVGRVGAKETQLALATRCLSTLRPRGMHARGEGERLATLGLGASVSSVGRRINRWSRKETASALGGAFIGIRNRRGNSKTLMVLNLSPRAAHLTSLRFATKVSPAQIGTANKVQIPSVGAPNPGNPGTLVLEHRKTKDR
ncbi:hypothetical protein FB451DRAFT_1189736 [Mycena latifolia]|nr:hypothetical protein FB451DRAFT_1189736 [Mycena latifolia]